jgi:PadR family transcriptional regulator, regulatory protein PadR
MKGDYLGEFEELILLIVASLSDDAYAVLVKKEAERIADRKVNISAVHSVLYRLENKGFLTSSLGGSSPKRGGKNKRIFQVTSAGMEMLKAAKELKEQLWKNIPQLSFAR